MCGALVSGVLQGVGRGNRVSGDLGQWDCDLFMIR